MIADLKKYANDGDVAGLRALLATPAGQEYGKGYRGAYYMLICQCQAAADDEEIDALCAAYPESYQKKTRKKKAWPVYVEQRKAKRRRKE